MKAIKTIPSKTNSDEKNVKGYHKKETKKVIYIWENNTSAPKTKRKNSKIKQEYKMQLALFGTKFKKHKKYSQTIKIIKESPK